MTDKIYPYLAKNSYKEHEYVVLFSEPDRGTIVMSDITDNPKLKFGTIGNFAEELFEVLGKDVCVRINN